MLAHAGQGPSGAENQTSTQEQLMSRLLRGVGSVLLGVAVALAALAGIPALGVATTMAQSFPAAPRTEVPPPAAARPLPRASSLLRWRSGPAGR